MRVTAADLAGLKRKQAQPPRAEGELLAIFVAGKLANPLNGTPWVWQKRTRYAKAWKERVALVLFERAHMMEDISFHPGPKRVQFLASTWSVMDGDGLQAALKPVRDALVECGVLSGDADRDGHLFEYSQRIDRTRRGVEIRVSLRAPAPREARDPECVTADRRRR